MGASAVTACSSQYTLADLKRERQTLDRLAV